MYKITHNKDVYPEDILEKALKGIAKKESDKRVRDPYLNKLYKENTVIFNKIIQAMIKDIEELITE